MVGKVPSCNDLNSIAAVAAAAGLGSAAIDPRPARCDSCRVYGVRDAIASSETNDSVVAIDSSAKMIETITNRTRINCRHPNPGCPVGSNGVDSTACELQRLSGRFDESCYLSVGKQ